MISELRQSNVGPTSQSCLEDIFVSLVCSHFLSCQLSFNFSVVPRSCHQRGPACYLWLLITYPVWLLVLRSWLRCLINSTDSNKHHLLSSSPPLHLSLHNCCCQPGLFVWDSTRGWWKGGGRQGGTLLLRCNIKPELFGTTSINLTELIQNL